MILVLINEFSSRNNFKLSILSLARENVLNRAVISDGLNFNLRHRLGDSSANKIFKAVPIPRLWIFPHRRHFSQITQSIIIDTRINLCLNSLIMSGLVFFKKFEFFALITDSLACKTFKAF